MSKTAALLLGTAALTAIAAFVAILVSGPSTQAEHGATEGRIDFAYIETTGTSARHSGVGSVLDFANRQECVEMPVGGTATIDVMVDEVHPENGLAGFEYFITWDGTVAQMTSFTYNMMLDEPDAFIFPVTDPPMPSTAGSLQFAALDLFNLGPSGTGVLVRHTFEGLSPGVSDLGVHSIIVGSVVPLGEDLIQEDTVIAGGFLAVEADCPETSASVVVHKQFNPFSSQEVTITLVCDDGTVLEPSSQTATAFQPAMFTVIDFDEGTTCIATESDVQGYESDATDCEEIGIGDGETSECTIVNTIRSAQVVVTKHFDDANPAEITVTLDCDDPEATILPSASRPASEGNPAVFTVQRFEEGTTCTATESDVPVGYESDATECEDRLIVDSQTTECEIANMLVGARVVVAKDFDDDNPAEITVTLACDDPEATILPSASLPASEGNPAEFMVLDAAKGTECTATENDVPDGYTSDNIDCQDMLIEGGQETECTIFNELIAPTPTPTPTPIPGVERIWGDLDCNDAVAIGDALKTARHLIDLPVDQEEGCPPPESEVTVDGESRLWGDVDCDGNMVIGDAVKVARSLIGLPVSQEEGCPEMGSTVLVEAEQ